MITIDDIHKSFGTQEVFRGATLQINGGDRFALMGPNGAGKSTLLRMMLWEEVPDGGEIRLRRGTTMGYLPQEVPPTGNGSVLQEALSEHEHPDGRLEAKAKEILMGLGFKTADFERPISSLSGGWAMRVAMARLLLGTPDVLLLDEPTNHLDLESLLWFQKRLQHYRGAILLISHDRAFVNAIAKSIVNVEGGRLKVYHGDYEHFLAQREADKERLEKAWREQQNEIAQMEDFIMRNRARASTAGRAQSMIKRLEKLERIELPSEAKTVSIRFPQPSRTGVRTLSLKGVHKSYGDLKVYQGLDLELERGQKIAFVGPNGAGKSTLLKMLAGVLPIDAGERVPGLNVRVGYYSQHRLEGLNPDNTVLQEALEANRANGELLVRTVLGSFLFPGDSVFKKVGVLSGGEKSRLALVKLLLDPPNVLLMDEPTTHLDMASVDALIRALKGFEGTLCAISHDIYFLNAVADHVLHVNGGKVVSYPGNYEYFVRRQEQLAREAEETRAHHRPSHSAHGSHAPHAHGEPHHHRPDPKSEKRSLELKKRLEELTRFLESPEAYADYARVREAGEELKAIQAELERSGGA